MNNGHGVTWKWLVGSLMSVLLVGGSTWLTVMYGEVGQIKEEQKVDRQTINDVKGKVGVIEEQTKRTQKDVEEIKGDLKDQNKKLDELLRRSR